MVLQATATQTASTNSTGLDLKTGTPKRGLVASFRCTTVAGTTPSCTFQISHSDDNTTFVDIASANPITAAGIVDITFETPKRYVRAETVISGTNPSFVWDAYIGSGKSTVN